MKIIKSTWVYSIKRAPDGRILKYKARLVVVGSSQKEGTDYDIAFAPMIKLESFRGLIAMASIQRLKIKQYGVKTAYIHGTLNTSVYMRQPDGFENKQEKDMVC